jgi:hypothetical protein
MGKIEIEQFLTHLAIRLKVSRTTEKTHSSCSNYRDEVNSIKNNVSSKKG